MPGPLGRASAPPALGLHLHQNPADSDTRYVDELIGPDTINTVPETTMAAFANHGALARTIDAGVDEAADLTRRFAAVGVDTDNVGLTLREPGFAGLHQACQQVLAALVVEGHQLSHRPETARDGRRPGRLVEPQVCGHHEDRCSTAGRQPTTTARCSPPTPVGTRRS